MRVALVSQAEEWDFYPPEHLNNQIRTTCKYAEALSSGRFIIATDVTEVRRTLGKNGRILDFKGGYNPRYHKRLANEIKRIYKNKNIIKNGLYGRKIAEKEYEYITLSKRLQGTIEKILVNN